MTPTPSLIAALLFGGALFAAEPATPPAPPSPGQAVFAMYCAACHGPEGAGLVGPNLTDNIFLHGGTRADILKTITKGVDGKGMPAWEAILKPPQIEAVADFAVSLIGKNLKSPFAPGVTTATAFPKGTEVRPLLMYTFMPLAGVTDEVFEHYHRGKPAAKYDPEKGSDVKGTIEPVAAIPTALAINFGDKLSYCFDTTECRLLYTWSGGFMDMTNYWGAGGGGGRKGFNYIPVVLGQIGYVTKGKSPLKLDGAPVYKGYHKVRDVPAIMYAMGSVAFTVAITPGAEPGIAVCRYTSTGATNGLVYDFSPDNAAQIAADKGTRSGATLTLSAAEAAAFTLTITPVKH